MREIEEYAAIEPVGEGMTDYSAGDKKPKRQATDMALKARLENLAEKQAKELAARDS